MVKKAISIFLVAQGAVFVTLLVSKGAFASAEVAFLSAFLVIVGSSYAYKNMVNTQVKKGEYEEKRDLLDEIEDPHELYDDTPHKRCPY